MARKEGLSEVLKPLGININGDLPDDKIVDIALKAERYGVAVWIGETELFKDPFYVADIIADHVSRVPIGFGTVSPLRRDCNEILSNVRALIKAHPDVDFFVGISPGDFDDPKTAVEVTLKCLKLLKSKLDIPIFCGCSSPIITRRSSKIADGILFNYGYPDFLRWIVQFMEEDTLKVAYAPALILPSEFEQDLLLACAIVSCSSKKFVEEFGFQEMCGDFASLDFKRLIAVRQKGGDLEKLEEFERILRYKDVLLEKFCISGDLDDVKIRIKELLKICDHVVLGDPFFRDKAVELLGYLV